MAHKMDVDKMGYIVIHNSTLQHRFVAYGLLTIN